MAGIDEIARETGLSKATVSRALRGLPSVAEDTVAAVRLAADRLGYVPSSAAAGLATGRNTAIGVIVPVIDRWFYVRVIVGIDAELRAAGFDLILYNLGGGAGDRDRVFHRSILRKRIDALIVLALAFDEEERAQLVATEYPAIAVGGPGTGVRHIGIDDEAAARLAVEHLLDLGHRRIAHIAGDDDLGINAVVPALRRDGYVGALTDAGLPVREDWVVDGRFAAEGGWSAARRVLADPCDRPTALFASSDEMALGAMAAARELGIRVPEELSVIGIDGHPDGILAGLSTVAQDPAEQGAEAARVLLGELSGEEHRSSFAPAPLQLIVRSSTAAPSPSLLG